MSRAAAVLLVLACTAAAHGAKLGQERAVRRHEEPFEVTPSISAAYASFIAEISMARGNLSAPADPPGPIPTDFGTWERRAAPATEITPEEIAVLEAGLSYVGYRPLALEAALSGRGLDGQRRTRLEVATAIFVFCAAPPTAPPKIQLARATTAALLFKARSFFGPSTTRRLFTLTHSVRGAKVALARMASRNNTGASISGYLRGLANTKRKVFVLKKPTHYAPETRIAFYPRVRRRLEVASRLLLALAGEFQAAASRRRQSFANKLRKLKARTAAGNRTHLLRLRSLKHPTKTLRPPQQRVPPPRKGTVNGRSPPKAKGGVKRGAKGGKQGKGAKKGAPKLSPKQKARNIGRDIDASKKLLKQSSSNFCLIPKGGKPRPAPKGAGAVRGAGSAKGGKKRHMLIEVLSMISKRKVVPCGVDAASAGSDPPEVVKNLNTAADVTGKLSTAAKVGALIDPALSPASQALGGVAGAVGQAAGAINAINGLFKGDRPKYVGDTLGVLADSVPKDAGPEVLDIVKRISAQQHAMASKDNAGAYSAAVGVVAPPLGLIGKVATNFIMGNSADASKLNGDVDRLLALRKQGTTSGITARLALTSIICAGKGDLDSPPYKACDDAVGQLSDADVKQRTMGLLSQ